MKRVILSIVAVIVLAILVVAGLVFIPAVSYSQPAYTSFTTLSVLSGDVFVLKQGTDTWVQVTDGMTIVTGDRVKTGAKAHALITFFEGSTMEVQPDTEVSIEEISTVDETGSTTIKLKQKVGETWNRVEKLIDPASCYEIESPAGAAVVRGTTIGVVVKLAGDTKAKVLEGEASFIAQEVEMLIAKGMEGGATPGKPPSDPTPIPPPNSILRLSICSPAWMRVVDPEGRSAGMVPPSLIVNQIPGAITSDYFTEPQFIEIPEPGAGTYPIVIYGKGDGTLRLVAEGLVREDTTFKTIFTEKREYQITDGQKYQIDLQASVEEDILDHIILGEFKPLVGDEPGCVIITRIAVDKRTKELAKRFDEKWEDFKNRVYAATPGEEVILVFTEDEVAGKAACLDFGPDSAVEQLYEVHVDFGFDTTRAARVLARLKYSGFTTNLSLEAAVGIEANKPEVLITNIRVGMLPAPSELVTNLIGETIGDIGWDIPITLTETDIGDGKLTIKGIKE